MPREFTGTTENIMQINEIAGRIYEKIAKAHALPLEIVHREGVCTRASRYFKEEAEEAGFSGVATLYEDLPIYGWHYHNAIGRWRFDLTYSQFLHYGIGSKSRNIDNLPRVLIAHEDSLEESLRDAGIPRPLRSLWIDARVVNRILLADNYQAAQRK